jgi:hypothetical protein
MEAESTHPAAGDEAEPTRVCEAEPESTSSRVSRRSVLQAGAAGFAFAVAPRFLSRPRQSTRLAAPREILRRAAWGADESRRNGIIEFDGGIERIVVHHTGTRNDPVDWPSQVREIYENETASGYRDIAYHFLVDPDGRIYEGRWARTYSDQVQPDAEDERGWTVRGGHALRHNPRTLGFAILGDYTHGPPSDAALDALVALLVWKCARWNLDPFGSSLYLSSSGVLESLPTIIGHGQVRETECPGAGIRRLFPHLRERVAAGLGRRVPVGGYWVVGRDGQPLAFGMVPSPLEGPRVGPRAIAGVRNEPAGAGYWTFASDGSVGTAGAARFHGSLSRAAGGSAVVGLAPRSEGDGYWLAAADGGVFAFGDAPFLGSLVNARLAAPIVAIEATASGEGYWLSAADGGVFAFGDAAYLGSAATTTPLTAPIVAMTATPDGYWLVARDGGVFAFGGAPFLGSALGSAPIVAMLPTTTNRGYALLTEPGEVLPFGDAPYLGSALGRVADATGIAGHLLGSGR